MKRFVIFLLVIVIVFFLRNPILRSFAKFLIYENEITDQFPVAFVLSGGSFDRGNHAAAVFKSGVVNQIVCTGENQSPDLKVFFEDKDILESTLTKIQIAKMGVPDSLIFLLKKGTSTLEESDYILEYCKEYNIDRCIVISSKFHTRRIKQVFKKKFKDNEVDLYITGAPSSGFDEMQWWKSEGGLIAVNNEYIKQGYYLARDIKNLFLWKK